MPEHAYALAVEKLLDIEVPKRGQYIRVLFSELSRILNHILNITTFALDVGAMTPLLWGFEEREFLMEFMSEHQVLVFTPHILGPGEFIKTYQTVCRRYCKVVGKFPGLCGGYGSLLTNNRIFKQRTVDIGAVNQDEAQSLGFTGPCIRASGLPWDLRKSVLTTATLKSTLIFLLAKQAIVMHGISFAWKMRQSLRIIKQCLDNIPTGL